MKSQIHPNSQMRPSDGSRAHTLIKDILASPELCLSSLDVRRNTMLFTPMSLETYRSSDFLDARMHRAGRSDVTVDLNDFVALFEHFNSQPKPLSIIFHTAYCCSTLLARCLENLNQTLVLKEPALLRQLSEAWFTKLPGHDLQKLNRVVGTLLSRRFSQESVIVKATSHCINMMPELLGLHADNRAVFLFSSLEDSLACYLKDVRRRREARFYLGVMGELVPPDLLLEAKFTNNDAQIIALLWMVQVRFYCQISESLSGGRLIALNCDDFLDTPALALERVASYFGISTTERALQDVLGSDAFKRYAKGQHIDFDREFRRAHLIWVSDLYAKEIEVATKWTRSLPLWSEIPEYLPNQLQLNAC